MHNSIVEAFLLFRVEEYCLKVRYFQNPPNLLESVKIVQKEHSMRIISLALALCFTFNVIAGTGTVQEFERALDEYHYDLSVEWDQKDQGFYDSKTKEFFTKLDSLIKEEGLSQNEIVTLLKSKIKDQKMIDSLVVKMNLLNKSGSVEELFKAIKDSTAHLYTRGASWNGQVILQATAALIVAAAIGYAVWFDANHVCVASRPQYVCQSYNNCFYGYTDITFGGYYCYGGTGFYTVCGEADICTQYARK